MDALGRLIRHVIRPPRRTGLAEEIATAKFGTTGYESVEVLFLGSAGGRVRDGFRPPPCETLIELLRNSVVIAAPFCSCNQTFLALDWTVPPVQNPCHANVVDMADAGAAQLLTLPAIRKLVVRQVRVHGAENVKEMRFRVNRRRG